MSRTVPLFSSVSLVYKLIQTKKEKIQNISVKGKETMFRKKQSVECPRLELVPIKPGNEIAIFACG
jgi:hypothetical protein